MIKYKVTVLGANSFIGRNFLYYLNTLDDISEIHMYDIHEEFFDDSLNSNYHKVDFSNKKSLSKIQLNVDAVFIFFGLTGTIAGFEKYETYININEVMLLNVLNTIKESIYKPKIIYPSTRLVYKENLRKPIKEEDEKQLKSIYAITKLAAENYIELYHETFNLNYCIFRLCTPWGNLLDDSKEHYGTFKFFVDKASNGEEISVYGDGSVIKTYTFIKDVCFILKQSIFNVELANDIFNIGGDSNSLQKLAEMIAEQYGVNVKNVEWPAISKKIDGGTTVLDSSKLDSILKLSYQKVDKKFFIVNKPEDSE